MTEFCEGFTGRGVRVAILDSGVVPDHPHVGGVTSGIEIRPTSTGNHWIDALGHGTAVAGAIREKAPDASLFIARIFHHSLAGTIGQLLRGLEWALEQQVHLVNLSLGTANAEHAARLAPLVRRAVAAGVGIVGARLIGTAPSFPGSMPGVVPVGVDWDLPRFTLAAGEDEIRASGYARSIPGVPDERNLRGVSFAVANTTGLLARAIEAGPQASAVYMQFLNSLPFRGA